MSRRKTERLLSLVVCLLSTRRYLTAEQIRAGGGRLSGASPRRSSGCSSATRKSCASWVSRWRPARSARWTARTSATGSQRQAYELPELRLEPDEAAVLGLAARVWQHAELAGAAAGALLKLRAGGIDTDDLGPDTRQGIEPRVHTTEPAFGPLWEAVRDRRPVTFAYRAVGRSEPQTRELEPWGVVNRHGRWYVAGQDRGRDAPRVFRLSRIAGPVRFSGPAGSVTMPPGIDVREVVRTWDSAPARENTAVLRVRTGAGYGLRRYATGPADPAGEGWDTISVPFSEASSSPTRWPRSARTWWWPSRPTCATR